MKEKVQELRAALAEAKTHAFTPARIFAALHALVDLIDAIVDELAPETDAAPPSSPRAPTDPPAQS